jgi:hypothetical protein
MRYSNSTGTKVNESTRLAQSEMMTESESGEKRYLAVPVRRNTGKNTTLIDSVARNVGRPTSPAPSTMARYNGLSRPTCRSMFSITTVELSTRIPTAKAKPPSVMVLRVWPRR